MAACVAVACAMPSYIAVPADQIAFVDLTALRARRVPRQTLSPPPQLPEALYEDNYQPIPLQNYQQGSKSNFNHFLKIKHKKSNPTQGLHVYQGIKSLNCGSLLAILYS